MTNRYFVIACLALITLVGAYFRFVGVNWDQNRHQHPDERFMTMVAEQIQPVDSFSDYFDPETSTLNPFEYGSYTYGMLPLFLTRYIAEWFALTSYDQIVLVGRVLSGVFDLAAIWVLYLIGARLYNRWIGLLASALYAGAVLPIQLSHFFAVDSFTTVFLLAAFYCLLRVMEKPKWWWFALFGAFTGLAMATKVSIAPLAGLILVVGALVIIKTWSEPETRGRQIKQVFLGVVIAGFFTVFLFRIFNPYAFSGPGFFGLSLNPRWVSIIRHVSSQVAGKSDFPPNHHWAGRSWSYGWVNMVQWGMGFPLGIVVTLGWGWAVWRIWKGEWNSHLLPVLWVGGYFFWQSSQFWRYTRYYLPIYPLAILLASWALIEAYKILQDNPPAMLGKLAHGEKRSLRRIMISALVIAIVAGTYVYSFSFIQIYKRPHTRVAASYWMLENIPGPFKAIVETEEGLQTIPLPQATNLTLETGDTWSGTFSSDKKGVLTGIYTPYLSLLNQGESAVKLTYAIAKQNTQLMDSEILLQLEDSKGQSSPSTYQIITPELAIEAGQPYDLTIKLETEAQLKLSGASIAVETRWDDSLPLPVSGIYAYPGLFQPLDLELFEPDTEEKRQNMLEALEQADFIVAASNRAFDAMPRLPLRYPMTLAYYQGLFSCDSQLIYECANTAQAPMTGDLGFDLIATFESYPNLGPISFPDQSAQESFTVYDHPRVYIFQKSDNYSTNLVRTILESVDLNQVIPQNAVQYTEAPTALRMSFDRLEAQKDGGTWHEIFSPSSVLNQTPFLGVFVWYFLIFLIGWFAFPITFFVFHGLTDRGYGFSRLIGMLVVGWVAWMGSSYELLPFTRQALWLGFGLLWIVAAVIAWTKFDLLINYLKEKWRLILVIEGIFLGLFIIGLILRWYNPDLWHPWRGGEKPGDLALFHAVLKTVYFPPYDPWMAGNFVNYFYFGYVLAAVPTKILGIVPEVAYNLLIPTWFSLTGVGLFSIAYNLISAQPTAKKVPSAKPSRTSLPYLAGGATLLLGLLLGNFAEIRILWEKLPQFSPDPITEPSPPQQAKDVVVGLGQILTGKQNFIQGDLGIWYFEATRAILSDEGVAPITEFPFFTFLYADLHPHLLGMPVVLCALAWLLSFLFFPPLVSKQSSSKDWLSLGGTWLIGGLVVGATYPTNTWDFPAILVLGGLAIGFASWKHPDLSLKHSILKMCLHIGLLFALAVSLYAPFRQWFSTSGLSPELWQGPRTSLGDYLIVHGLFIFIIVTFLLVETWQWIRPIMSKVIHIPLGELVPKPWKLIAIVGISVTAIIGSGWLWRNDFQTVVFVNLLGLWTVMLFLQKGLSLNRKVTLILIGAGLGLSLIAELVSLQGDIGRMNVVFKSYLLVWFFFSIAGGGILSFIWRRIRSWKTGWVWLGGLGILVIGAGIYPVTGTLARINDRWPGIQNPPRTLDGLTFMNGESGASQFSGNSVVFLEQDTALRLANDYQAFLWIRNNIQGTPTIVEGHTSEYRWGSRYSVYTGLPTVVGWSWHLRQHNAVLPDSVVENRISDVNNFYNTTDHLEAFAFLSEYHVDLIVVGELERVLYSETGIAKFEQMAANGDLKLIYPNGEEARVVSIYAVP